MDVNISDFCIHDICDMYFIMHTNDEKEILIQNNAHTI